MGCEWRIVLHAADARKAELAATAAFERVAVLESVLSDWEPESEVRRLARDATPGAWHPVSPTLSRALHLSLGWARATGGHFDPTLGPLVSLWRKSHLNGQVPNPARVKAARARCGWDKIELDPAGGRIRLGADGMKLDLGGCAKGWAAERALRELERRGIPCALVDAGGDLVAGTPPPGKSGWHIGVAAQPGRPPLAIAHLAVATSGNRSRHVVIDGRRYGHLIDVRTGLGSTELREVTVIATRGLAADAIASALCTLPTARAQQLVESTAGVEALVVLEGGKEWRSSGLLALSSQ